MSFIKYEVSCLLAILGFGNPEEKGLVNYFFGPAHWELFALFRPNFTVILASQIKSFRRERRHCLFYNAKFELTKAQAN
jgi:hypothetical protein